MISDYQSVMESIIGGDGTLTDEYRPKDETR